MIMGGQPSNRGADVPRGLRRHRTVLALAACAVACGSSPPHRQVPDQPPRLTRLDILAGQPGGRGWVDGALVAAHFQEPWEIAGDGANTLYVADSNIVRAIDRASGSVTTLAGSYGHSGTNDGVGTAALFSLPSGLAFSSGELYVSDTENDTIRKIDVASGEVTTVAGAPRVRGKTDGNLVDARFSEPEGIALDPSGKLYIADTDNNLIRVLDLNAGTVSTVAGNSEVSALIDGVGAAAAFYNPKAMRIDAAGNLYVADAYNTAVRKVVPSTGVVSTLAKFQSVPQGLAVDGADLLVSLQGTSGENRIVRVKSDGSVSPVAGSETSSGFVDAVGVDARFYGPAGLYNDGSGTLYIADAANFVLRKMAIADGTVSTFAGANSMGASDGMGTRARFSAPRGLAVDETTAYVADTGNDTIRTIDLATGAVKTLAGAVGQIGHVDGPFGTARFDGPQGLALDSASKLLYVADTLSRVIRQVDLGNGIVSTLSPTPTPTFGGLDGPSGLALVGTHLFVTDSSDDDVAEIDLQSSQISLLAGQFGIPGTEDGVGARAGFYVPVGIASDGNGNLYVADNQGCTVRKIVIASATVSTIAGKPGSSGFADGVGAVAYFGQPFGAAANDLGDLFISDTSNNAVRRVDVSNGTVTTILGAPAIYGVRLGTLPAQLTLPSAVALTRTGGLLVASENAILVAH
jgi:sugar lactone lactonase YvrE